MTLPFVLSLVLPIYTGWMVVSALWSPGREAVPQRLIRGILALGIGLGLASAGFFLAVVLWGPGRGATMTADVVLLLGALALRRACGRRAAAARPDNGPAPSRAAWPRRLLRMSAGLAVVSGVAAWGLLARSRPHGDWDAWAIWNLRARFLVRGGDHWQDGFSALVGWSHPDYPLLLPGLVARSWLYAGREAVLVPVTLALWFTFATIGLVSAAVAARRGESQGWLAALVLVSTPTFLTMGTTQMADVPLGFFFLATLVALGLSDLTANRRGLLGLAGILLGLSAWVKDEGLVFGGAVLLARLMTTVRRTGWRESLGELGGLAVGLVPVLCVVAYFKLRVAPPNPFLAPGAEPLLRRLADVDRYLQIARAFAAEARAFGGWPVTVVGLLAAYLLVVGRRVPVGERASVAAGGLALALTVMGYLGVYVVSPYPLAWHLATSLPRLLVPLWPGWVLAYFLVVSPPEQLRVGAVAGPVAA